MAKSRKNISLSDLVLEKATERAEQLGFDFSSYLAHLILNDLSGTKTNIEFTESNINISEESREESELDSEVWDSVDEIEKM